MNPAESRRLRFERIERAQVAFQTRRHGRVIGESFHGPLGWLPWPEGTHGTIPPLPHQRTARAAELALVAYAKRREAAA